MDSLFSRLEKRERRTRSAGAAAFALLIVGIPVALVTALLYLLRMPLRPPWSVVLTFLPLASALAVYAVRWRSPVDLPRLLLQVDERLGLEARLSSLYQLMQRDNLPAFRERLSRQIEQRKPDWSRSIRLRRSSFAFGAVGCLCLAVAVFFGLVLSTDAQAPSRLASHRASSESAQIGAPSTEETQSALLSPPTDVDHEATTGAGANPTSGATLSSILAELRANQAASSGTASATELDGGDSATGSGSEGSSTSWIDRLRAIRDRLDRDASPLTSDETDALRAAAANAPAAVREDLEASLAASDLEALRNTIEQLVPSDDQTDLSTPTVTRAQASQSPEQPVEIPGGTSASTTPSGSSDTSSGTAGEGAPDVNPGQGEPSAIFDSSIGQVQPVSPNTVIGTEGGFTDYITAGVPVDSSSEEAGQADAVAFSPAQVESLLSTRSLPEPALQAIQDYFERITKETP
jgi:hypothetical protein